MNKNGLGAKRAGFTLVELVIGIVVIGILSAISIVVYGGMQKESAKSVLISTLVDAQKLIKLNDIKNNSVPAALPSELKIPNDVAVTYIPGGGIKYSGLDAVQNGVLFHSICDDLSKDPAYATIHSSDGASTQSVIMSCEDNISANGIQITGWQTKNWTTPISRSQLESYISSVPYDSWWTDKQRVIRDFYTQLIVRFTNQGGTWPISSFWDPWANQWSGVQKEALPTPTTGEAGVYCIKATHNKYPDLSFYTSDKVDGAKEGNC